MEKENEIPIKFKNIIEIEKKRIENNRKILLIGMKGEEIITLDEEKAIYMLDLLYEKGYLNERYFDFIRQKAISHILSPTAYEKTMWKETRLDKLLTQAETLNEESLFSFECWIEDKYKPGEVAILINKYAIFDHLYINYFSVEDDSEMENEGIGKYKRKTKREEIVR